MVAFNPDFAPSAPLASPTATPTGPATNRDQLRAQLKEILSDPRSPLTNDPATRQFLEKIHAAFDPATSPAERAQALGTVQNIQEVVEKLLKGGAPSADLQKALEQVLHTLNRIQEYLSKELKAQQPIPTSSRPFIQPLDQNEPPMFLRVRGGGGSTVEKVELKDPNYKSLWGHVSEVTGNGGQALAEGHRRQDEAKHAAAVAMREKVHQEIVKLVDSLKALDMMDGRDGGPALAAILSGICEAYPPSAGSLRAQVEEINARQAREEQAEKRNSGLRETAETVRRMLTDPQVT
jgi:hypothetical protein